MSSELIANEIAEKEKALKELQKNDQIVEQEILTIQRQILDLQTKKKDLEITRSKSRHLVTEMRLDIKMKTADFWREKNSGQ